MGSQQKKTAFAQYGAAPQHSTGLEFAEISEAGESVPTLAELEGFIS